MTKYHFRDVRKMVARILLTKNKTRAFGSPLPRLVCAVRKTETIPATARFNSQARDPPPLTHTATIMKSSPSKGDVWCA
jgi:hypothetical protein